MRTSMAIWALLAAMFAQAGMAGCGKPEPSGEAHVRWPIFGGEQAAGTPGAMAQSVESSRGSGTASTATGQTSGPGGAGLTPVTAEPMEPVPETSPGSSAAPGSSPAGESERARPGVGDRKEGQRLQIVNAIVARVNDEVITREDVLRDMRSDMARWQETMAPEAFEARVRETAGEQLRAEISRRLILQEARRRYSEEQLKYLEGEVDKERARQIAASGGNRGSWLALLEAAGLTEAEWRRRQLELLTAQVLLSQEIEPRMAVTQDEMLAYYERVKKEKYEIAGRARPQLIKLRLEDHADLEGMLAVARSLVGKARAGQDFGQLARQFSKDPKAEEGGDWGLLHRGSFRVDAADEALFTLPVGGVSDPIVDGNAVYIVKVAERIDARTIPFNEVQDECRAAVRKAKRDQLITEYLDRLYKKGRVEVFEGNL